MSIPKKTDSWVVSGKGGFDDLKLQKSVDIPELGDCDCLVKIQAVSLNYRDLVIPKGKYPFPVKFPLVPCSDAAGIVIATGPNVSLFKKGDKVCTLFNQLHQAGAMTPRALSSGLGGAIDGTLRQYAVFPETGLVSAPRNLRPVEAATLPCAPVTAWNSLYGLESKALRPGEVVLTQGTGGVSIAALQFAVAAGAMVIATTSSDDKAKRLKEMGAHHVINYTTDPDWGETAAKLTPGGLGAHHIIEVGGPNTMAQSLKAIKFDGVISVIGFLGGPDAEHQPGMLDALTNQCIVRGILVGSRLQFEEMNRAIEACDIRPVLDSEAFEFEHAKDAYQHMWDQKHFGNVVVQVQD